MSAWLDEITDQFVPVPDHFCRVVGIAENFRESVVVYGTLRIWIVNYVQALPQVGVWRCGRKFTAPLSVIQSSPLSQLITDGGSAVNRNGSSSTASSPSSSVATCFISDAVRWPGRPGS